MTPFEFVIAIIALVFGYKLISQRMQQKHTQRAPDSEFLGARRPFN